MTDNTKMEKIVSLAKQRGFIFQGSEIYGGLAGTWDYGPLGLALKNNIKKLWWDTFVEKRSDIYGVDAAILMNEKVWDASGHTGAGFTDPLVECTKCKKRFREDHLEGTDCPSCGGELGEKKDFNLMFETKVGAQGNQRSYLRPETAQGIFVNFKNVVDTMRPKLPFGIAQSGKAFRNEIAPRDFVFRSREFEIMELEYFVEEKEWESEFSKWQEAIWNWTDSLGLSRDNLREVEVEGSDLAHYSKRTVDLEYNYPGKGFDELSGLAYRTDHDLKSHQEASGTKMTYTPVDGEPFIPHVIEPTFGVERALMAVLAESYTEDDLGDGRVFLKLSKQLAPIKVAVFPLMKNKPELVSKAREVYEELRETIPQVMFDDNGNVGKRYRRQDEIGTPWCVTIDFDTLEDNTVTLRDRDTGEQQRIALTALVEALDL
ncbi:glycine--tRNA ligase [Candidatus Kaiserbacteria bacterium]|nr:MAG: glycine--tRNA ligase [Candidatus Kaiserbacteria bacterium]